MNDIYYRKRIQQSKESRKHQKKIKPLSEEIRSASTMLMATIGVLIVSSGLSFLYISSLQSAKGYELQQLQGLNEQLVIENRELQGQLNKAQAISNVEKMDRVASMTKETETINYVGDTTNLASR